MRQRVTLSRGGGLRRGRQLRLSHTGRSSPGWDGACGSPRMCREDEGGGKGERSILLCSPCSSTLPVPGFGAAGLEPCMGTLPAPPGCWGSPEPRRDEPDPSAPSVPPSRLGCVSAGREGSWAHPRLEPQNIANRTRNTLFRYSSGGHFSHPIPSQSDPLSHCLSHPISFPISHPIPCLPGGFLPSRWRRLAPKSQGGRTPSIPGLKGLFCLSSPFAIRLPLTKARHTRAQLSTGTAPAHAHRCLKCLLGMAS